MNILLVHPTFDPKNNKIWLSPEQLPPPFLGINLLATILEQDGHNVEVLDELYKYFLDAKYGYKTWGERVTEIIEKKDIDILGITVLTHFRTLCFEIAKKAKVLKPEIKVILGGPHATFTYKQILKAFPEIIDAIVIREGEYAIKNIVDNIKNGDNNFIRIPNVVTPEKDDLPNIESQIYLDGNPTIDYARYQRFNPPGFKRAMIISTRGCPYHECIFCSAKELTPGYRERSSDKVLEDISSLAKYGVKTIEFHDEIFILHHARIEDIFSGLQRKQISFDDFYSHCRPADLTHDNLKAISATGQNWRIFIGLESGSEKLRETLCKFIATPVTNKTIMRNVSDAKKFDIPVGVFLIFGTPGENLDTVTQTYELLQEIKPSDAFCSVLRIYPGTKLYARALKEGIIREDDWTNKVDKPFFFYPQDKDYYLARAAVELFTECFSSEKIRAKAEQSLDAYLYTDTEADLEQLDR